MFHSSSIRHEQYIRKNRNGKATIRKKRSSLESEGNDSGYNSSSSTIAIQTQIIEKEQEIKKISSTNNIKPPSITTSNSSKTRQPDLVYSCPRPLTFPFHNDDHFLPIAEADPRDVARVSPPSLNRTISLNSESSTSHLLSKDIDSVYSSSILSTIQRGTVRSLRSIFQLSESDNLVNSSRITTQKIEIKKGTVQSIRDLFNQFTPQNQQDYSTSNLKKSKLDQPTMGIKINVTPSQPISFTDRAKELGSTIIHQISSHTPTPSGITSKVKEFSTKLFNWSKDTTEPDQKKSDDTKIPEELPVQETTVKRIWSSFKNLVTGRKSSRIGIM